MPKPNPKPASKPGKSNATKEYMDRATKVAHERSSRSNGKPATEPERKPRPGLNTVQLLGFLGADPELRYTQADQAVTNLRIATTEVWAKDGEPQSHTEWHRCVVWGGQAEACAKFLAKGSQVYLQGKIRTRKWEDSDGEARYSTEIHADRVIFLGSAKKPAESDGDEPSEGSDGDVAF